MDEFNWISFLENTSQKVIESYIKARSRDDFTDWLWEEVTPERVKSGWLGFPGASEETIRAHEIRLGLSLPESYQNFLKITNGWPEYPNMLKLLPVDKIDYLYKLENKKWIDEWIRIHQQHISPTSDENYLIYTKNIYQPLRTEYLKYAIQISENVENDIFLLNPKIKHNDEWEAWIFSCRTPGAIRYRTFQDMCQSIKFLDMWSDV
ncbi:MAG: SMI1/KNR4 family protein [Cyanothece sp. SIO2G6]|nr:SMI1/KNR4 family protein [Cyanothece sp. SIO2G6]